jgi:hypothetical protein
MKVKTNTLEGRKLNWAVATACGHKVEIYSNAICVQKRPRGPYEEFEPSEQWEDGGPILSRERISRTIDHSGLWVAYWSDGYTEGDEGKLHMQCDQSELVAGLRCVVARKLGDEVEVPDELV